METEISNFRARLEKSLSTEETSVEEFTDVLAALKQIPITIDLLRKTKIGQTLQEVKKKHSADDVGVQTKALLSKWKKDCESVDDSKLKSEPVTPKESTSAKTVTSPPKAWGGLVSKDTSVANKKEDEDVVDESHYNALSTQRRQVRRK